VNQGKKLLFFPVAGNKRKFAVFHFPYILTRPRYTSIYIYIYICTYIYTVYLYLDIHIPYIYKHIYIYIYIYICIPYCICIYVYIYTCAYVLLFKMENGSPGKFFLYPFTVCSSCKWKLYQLANCFKICRCVFFTYWIHTGFDNT
jgi:hypothetical protein